MNELTRWNDDAPIDYLEAKQAHAELGPDADQLARLLARLPSADGPQTATSTATGTASALGGKSWLWLVPGLALLGLTGWLLYRSAPEQAQPVESHVPSRIEEAPQAAPALPIVEEPAATSAPRKRMSSEKRPRAIAESPDPAAELLLLERARRVLASNPARTLALTDEHRQTFRPGLFAQERELLGIEALMRLKQTQAATRRAQAFTREHPNSVHARRLETLLRGEETQ